MRQYELTYLISDLVPEAEINKVTGKVGGYVTDAEGKIIKEEVWGRRKLAYPIQKQEFATYVTIIIELPPHKALEFEHNIKMTSKIVRHLMLVQDGGVKEFSLSADEIVKESEIEELLGEKSFEMVEGETEESRDLMAVREDKSEESEEEVAESTEAEATPEIVEEKPAEVTEEAAVEDQGLEDKGQNEEEVIAEVKPKKAATKKPAKKAAKTSSSAEATADLREEQPDEADRLTKLDKELDDILGDDL